MRALILGSGGMVGSAFHRAFRDSLESGEGRKWSASVTHRGHDLRIPHGVNSILCQGWDVVFLCAARVGGIKANMERPAEFIYDNLMIQTNVIDACLRYKVGLLVFLGSSCIYPRVSPLGVWKESDLMTGRLEPTNEAYAMAKLAGLKMCEAYAKQHGFQYLAPMPCNLYGPGDRFLGDLPHMVPALIRKFHEAKERGDRRIALWGTGNPRRELLHVDDLVSAVLHLIDIGYRGVINVGAGVDWTVRFIAQQIATVVGYPYGVDWDESQPDGIQQKLMDISKIQATGWAPRFNLPAGLAHTYDWYRDNAESLR